MSANVVVNNSFGHPSGSTMIPEENKSSAVKYRVERDSIGEKKADEFGK